MLPVRRLVLHGRKRHSCEVAVGTLSCPHYVPHGLAARPIGLPFGQTKESHMPRTTLDGSFSRQLDQG